jgi:ribosomal protein S18 acetylase RimI-like enzyme
LSTDSAEFRVVAVDESNIVDYPQVICFINPGHETHGIKVDWLRKRFEEGMKIKLLYLEGEKKPAGFIEYTPGEHAWRAVSADGYLFIHCIWVYPNKNKNRGIGTKLLDVCREDAEKAGRLGVAVVASTGPFMAKKDLFVKNGFKVVESSGSRYELLAKQIKKGMPPKFNDWQKALASYRGLNIVYTNQCPWVARFVSEMRGKADRLNPKLTFTELKTPAQARSAPSPYATFNLIHDGKLLADHYISETRFMNIVKRFCK